MDNVWVFWKAILIFPEKGRFSVNVRASDIHGNVQLEDDPYFTAVTFDDRTLGQRYQDPYYSGYSMNPNLVPRLPA